jgi:hypothetical protein
MLLAGVEDQSRAQLIVVNVGWLTSHTPYWFGLRITLQKPRLATGFTFFLCFGQKSP